MVISLAAVFGMEVGVVGDLFAVCEESGLDEGEGGAVSGEPFEGNAEGDEGLLKARKPTERPFDGERSFQYRIIEQWSQKCRPTSRELSSCFIPIVLIVLLGRSLAA